MNKRFVYQRYTRTGTLLALHSIEKIPFILQEKYFQIGKTRQSIDLNSGRLWLCLVCKKFTSFSFTQEAKICNLNMILDQFSLSRKT